MVLTCFLFILLTRVCPGFSFLRRTSGEPPENPGERNVKRSEQGSLPRGDLPKNPNRYQAISNLKTAIIEYSCQIERWWSEMEFLTHRLKSGKVERAILTVRELSNESPWLRLCFSWTESNLSLDTDIMWDVQQSKNVVPENCSVLEKRGANAPFGERNHGSMASPVAQPGCHQMSYPMPHHTQRHWNLPCAKI